MVYTICDEANLLVKPEIQEKYWIRLAYTYITKMAACTPYFQLYKRMPHHRKDATFVSAMNTNNIIWMLPREIFVTDYKFLINIILRK